MSLVSGASLALKVLDCDKGIETLRDSEASSSCPNRTELSGSATAAVSPPIGL